MWWLLLCVGCLAQWQRVNIDGLFEDYGCEFSGLPRLGYLFRANLSQCQDACLNDVPLTEGSNDGCNAVEWHNTTHWCNLYAQLCTSVEPRDIIGRGSWYRHFGFPGTFFPVSCVLPHRDKGAVKCIPSVVGRGSTCTSFSPSPPPGAYTQTLAFGGGFVINCNEFSSSYFHNSPSNPCDVLGCAPVSPSSPGYTAYRYRPTREPTTQAPTRLPTTPAPTALGATYAPTSGSPTSGPTTAVPTSSPTLPPTGAPTANFCALNLTGSLFKLKNCSNGQVLRNSSCELICDSQRDRTDLFVNCSSEGWVSWPPACVLQGVLEGAAISMRLGLDLTKSDCPIDTSDATDMALITEAFANNIAEQLIILNGSSVNLTVTTTSGGFAEFLLVLRDRPPNSTATEDANTLLELLTDVNKRNNLLSLYFMRNGTECNVQASLVRFFIDFESLFRLLFDLLANMPAYGVALLLLALAAVVVLIPWASRKSPHPFALLLLLTSMFSFANRVYFLTFVADLAARAADRDASLAPLKDIYVATAVFLGLSMGLNVLLATVLCCGLRDSSKSQQRWVQLHPGSAVFGLLVSAFNPGNILILRSKLCNSESLSAPFPVQYLRRLEWIGLGCALVGDLPPLILTSLTMQIVQGSSYFNWNQTKLNLLLPIVFSSVVVVVAIATRCCKIHRYTATMREDTKASMSNIPSLSSSPTISLARIEG